MTHVRISSIAFNMCMYLHIYTPRYMQIIMVHLIYVCAETERERQRYLWVSYLVFKYGFSESHAFSSSFASGFLSTAVPIWFLLLWGFVDWFLTPSAACAHSIHVGFCWPMALFAQWPMAVCFCLPAQISSSCCAYGHDHFMEYVWPRSWSLHELLMAAARTH